MQAQAPKREAEVVVQPAPCMPRARGEVILVVEDDPDLLVLTASKLQSLGYQTLTAEDGRACARLLENAEHLDLLLTDVVLPLGISGVQLARAARQRYANLKVLFMSGYAENAIAHDGGLEDGDLLLAKPFRKADLARMVRAAIDGSQRD